MSTTARLAGRAAIITGGSSGIGESIATRFAIEGAKVVIASRDAARCEKVAHGIRNQGGSALAIPCDVTSEESVRSLFNSARSAFGTIDIHVASAGISGGSSPIENYSLEHWERVLRTNLTGAFLTCREAFVGMKESGGHIIVISSQAGVEAYAGKGVYSASKFGVRGFAHVLGEEGRQLGINVSSLCPGTVDTPILAATNTKVAHPLSLEALSDAALYLASLRGNSLIRDIVLERMNQR